jgi:hypothetical protein
MLLVVTLVASCGGSPPDAADVGFAATGAASTVPTLWPLAVLGPLPAVVETWEQAQQGDRREPE